MVFSSLLFLFRFLPVVLIFYFLAPKSKRNLVLFLSSLFFYAWGEPVYVVLMIFSTVVDFVHGNLVERFQKRGQTAYAKMAVFSSVCINLTLLGFFKYADFLIINVNRLLHLDLAPLDLALPIGISFYTFQTMSYTIDIYRDEAVAQKNMVDFGAYVALFPQLIAGPIVRYQTIAQQLLCRRTTWELFGGGILRFIIGLGKKVLLANNIGILWNQISSTDPASLSAATALLGITAFGLQIYFDFSGYSDMAVGLGKIFGFTFPENFDYPYESKSITEFWRRWHITLGTWFREYVYIPLGGNKKGKGRQIRNIVIVWLLTGVWHGAEWNYAVWGLYFAVVLIIEKRFLLTRLRQIPNIVSGGYTLILILISWIIFAFEDPNSGISYFKSLTCMNENPLADGTALFYLLNYGIIFIILLAGCTHYPKLWAQNIWNRLSAPADEYKSHSSACIRNGLQALLLCIFTGGILLMSVAYLVDASYNPFLYFRF